MSKIVKILYTDSRFEFFISTRRKGYSVAPYSSLNLGLNTGDDIVRVAMNRKKFLKKAKIDPDDLVFAQQVHGAAVKYVNKSGYYLETDGFISSNKNIALSVTVADCFPAFIAAPDIEHIALLHMGWRGTAAGILENAMKKLTDVGANPESMTLVTGPGIGKKHFEVGLELKKHFPSEKYWSDISEEKGYLDLEQVIKDIFLSEGGNEENYHSSGECTYADEKNYFSHRRDGGVTGRMMAVAVFKS